MPQSNAAPADTAAQQEAPPKSFSKKAPTPLYDNGHGTRVVRWEEGVSNLTIERSYKPKDSTEYVTDRINVTPEEALGIMFGLQKGVEQSMEKLANKQQGASRT